MARRSRPLLVLLCALAGWAMPASAIPPIPSPLRAAELRRQAELRTERAAEVAAREIKDGDKSLRWLEREFNLAQEGEVELPLQPAEGLVPVLDL
ncbi:hypothetical protein EBR16_08510, partial [bacterium]|nr:hypothetical protein [bacterium]